MGIQNGNPSLVGAWLDQVTRPIGTVLADGVYDGKPVCRTIGPDCPLVLIAVRREAVVVIADRYVADIMARLADPDFTHVWDASPYIRRHSGHRRLAATEDDTRDRDPRIIQCPWYKVRPDFSVDRDFRHIGSLQLYNRSPVASTYGESLQYGN